MGQLFPRGAGGRGQQGAGTEKLKAFDLKKLRVIKGQGAAGGSDF